MQQNMNVIPSRRFNLTFINTFHFFILHEKRISLGWAPVTQRQIIYNILYLEKAS